MRFLSVCSGIEAASVAWHPLGWRAAGFSEIEPFPCSLLAHRYPSVPNHGDMTKFKDWPDEPVDLLVGGTPCQSFSIAGLRKGLDDPRGNLMLTYGAIAARYRPEWLVWENVPGVLSSNGGRDFGTFLGMLAELRYGFAYRVLDAQFFGVAQRRRRVFVVANARGWASAAAVLFERESLSGHPAPRRDQGEEIAQCLTTGVGKRYDPETETLPVAYFPWQSALDPIGNPTDLSGTLVKNQTPAAMIGKAVRRLTPRECERLQGFPDDYTLIQHRGKPAADGPRYKALGNSMAVPVMAWIGQRIQQVNAMTEAA
jgi:DNA (cytosine-5)-methyltransferase 1